MCGVDPGLSPWGNTTGEVGDVSDCVGTFGSSVPKGLCAMAMIDRVPHLLGYPIGMRICGPHIELTLTRYMGSGITLRVLQYRDQYYLSSRDPLALPRTDVLRRRVRRLNRRPGFRCAACGFDFERRRTLVAYPRPVVGPGPSPAAGSGTAVEPVRPRVGV